MDNTVLIAIIGGLLGGSAVAALINQLDGSAFALAFWSLVRWAGCWSRL